MIFKKHEITIIEALTKDIFSPPFFADLLDNSKIVDFHYSGCGYFLTVTHPRLPVERVVCGKPIVTGKANGIDSGFIVLIENRELTLECYSLNDVQVPDGYRDLPISIEINS